MDADPQNHAWRVGPGLVAALTALGIATGLGVTTAVGCTSPRPWMLAPLSFGAPWSDPLNCLLAIQLVGVACLAMVTSRRIALRLMGAEFAGFLLFLYYLRGGYAVGIIGAPLQQVVQFDALSVVVRVSVLGLLAFKEPLSRRLPFKVAVVGAGIAMALTIVATKATLHPIPLFW